MEGILAIKEIISLNIDDLDIAELERRLEMAPIMPGLNDCTTYSCSCNGCGSNGSCCGANCGSNCSANGGGGGLGCSRLC